MQRNRNQQKRNQPAPVIEPKAPKLNYHQRCVAAAFATGRITCSNPAHFVLTKREGATYPEVTQLNPSRIVSLMKLREEASCDCQRAACEWAWAHQDRHGLTTDEFVMYGKYCRGVFKNDTVTKRVVQPAYAMADTSLLSTMFPNVHFVTSPFAPTHDHPISHTVTDLARRMLYDSLARGSVEAPKRYLDLHGNPSVAASYNRNVRGVVIETMVELITAKDFLRSKKWPSSPRLWVRGPISALEPEYLKRFDGFISVHTSYYYDVEFYDQLFTQCPDATISILVHRFDSDDGMINGELSYKRFERDGKMMVVQKNSLGSDSYTHPNNSFWFESNARVLGSNGMAWSTNQICPGTWTVQACACAREVVEPTVKVMITDPYSTEYMLDKGEVVAQVGEYKLSCPIREGEVKFFDDMRRWVATKTRSHDVFRDFVARYKSYLDGPRKRYSIDGHLAKRLALVAFFIDCKTEAAILPMLFEFTSKDRELLQTMVAPKRYFVDRVYDMKFAFTGLMTFRQPSRLLAHKQLALPFDQLPKYSEVD